MNAGGSGSVSLVNPGGGLCPGVTINGAANWWLCEQFQSIANDRPVSEGLYEGSGKLVIDLSVPSASGTK